MPTTPFSASRPPPLWELPHGGDAAAMELALDQGAAIDRPNHHGHAPLSICAARGHERGVALLIARGARLEVFRHDGMGWGQNALFSACLNGHAGCAAALLAAGARPDPPAEPARLLGPLGIAAREGHSECCHALLRAGALVEPLDKRGFTPLMEASRLGRIECVKILLAAGANPEARCDQGRSALEWAQWDSADENAEVLSLLAAAELSWREAREIAKLSEAAHSRRSPPRV